MNAIEQLKSVLCNHDGKCCISGSNEDRAIVDRALQALAQPEQESATVLPDGSAFAVMSYPLPEDHWLYTERQYNDGTDDPVELGKPILTHEMDNAVVSAVRYAIRGATNCGKEVDFDPDALVQNAVYALCGPYITSPQPEQEPFTPPKKWRDSEIADGYRGIRWVTVDGVYGTPTQEDVVKYLGYTTPPQRTWVELTDEDDIDWEEGGDLKSFVKAIEAKLRSKNT